MPLWANSWNWIGTHGTLLVPLLLGFIAVWALLPKHKHRQLLLGCVTGLGALVIGGVLLPQAFGPDVPLAYELLFFPFAGMAVAAGLIMIVQRNPVYSALWFAVVILNTCGLFLLQGGTFLAAATIIIYTGAIIVTFLFVMMLAQQTGTADYDRRAREPFLATLAGFVLLGGLLYTLELTYKKTTPLASIQDRLENARHRLHDPKVKVKDVAEELRVESSDGKRRSIRELLETEADRYPGWPGREQAKQQIADANFKLGQASGTDDREKMKEAVELFIKWAEAIRIAGERHAAKLAALPKDKTSPLSKMELPQEKAATGPPPDPRNPPPFQPKPGHVTGLGRSLFGDYLYAVALSAELLLVVTIGAIVITHRRKEGAA